MNAIKVILIAVVAILGAAIAFAVIGMIMTAVQYLFWPSVLCIAAVVAVKLFKKPDPPQLESKEHVKELKNTERTLEEYKRKYLAK